MTQSRYRMFPSPQGSLLTPFCGTPTSVLLLPPPFNPWQPLICFPLLSFSHFKNAIEMESYSMQPFQFGFLFLQRNSLEIHSGCVYQLFVSFNCSVVIHCGLLPRFVYLFTIAVHWVISSFQLSQKSRREHHVQVVLLVFFPWFCFVLFCVVFFVFFFVFCEPKFPFPWNTHASVQLLGDMVVVCLTV